MFTAGTQKIDCKWPRSSMPCALPIVAQLCLARRYDVVRAVVHITLRLSLAKNALNVVSISMENAEIAFEPITPLNVPRTFLMSTLRQQH